MAQHFGDFLQVRCWRSWSSPQLRRRGPTPWNDTLRLPGSSLSLTVTVFSKKPTGGGRAKGHGLVVAGVRSKSQLRFASPFIPPKALRLKVADVGMVEASVALFTPVMLDIGFCQRPSRPMPCERKWKPRLLFEPVSMLSTPSNFFEPPARGSAKSGGIPGKDHEEAPQQDPQSHGNESRRHFHASNRKEARKGSQCCGAAMQTRLCSAARTMRQTASVASPSARLLPACGVEAFGS